MSILKNVFPAFSRLQNGGFVRYSRHPFCTDSKQHNKSFLDVERKFEIIKTEIQKLNPDFNFNIRNSEAIKDLILNYPGSSWSWSNSIANSPELLKMETESLTKTVECFKKFSIKKHISWKILGDYPSIAELSSKKLRECLNNLSALCHHYDLNMRELLISVPNILECENETLSIRLSQLNDYFRKNDMCDLIVSAPTVLLEDWRKLEDKINYLYDVMHVHPNDICNSSVLMHDIELIKSRFSFIDRAGLYKHPNPKGTGDNLKSEPFIGDIVYGTDEDFVKTISGNSLTLEEYQTFLKVLENERDAFYKNYDRDGYEDDVHQDNYEETIRFNKMGRKSEK